MSELEDTLKLSASYDEMVRRIKNTAATVAANKDMFQMSQSIGDYQKVMASGCLANMLRIVISDAPLLLDQVDELSEELDMARAVASCVPTLPNSFTAHGPGSDHWIAMSEAGKPKSIKGCGCRLNGECAIKGDWAPGQSSSCDECRYQTTDQTDPQPNKPSTVCPHCYEAGHMVCVPGCYHLSTTKAERDAAWEENQRQMHARKRKGS